MCAAAGFPNNQCQASSENKATIEGIIELAVQETNEAFANSGIKTTLRAVKVHYEDEFDDTAEPWHLCDGCFVIHIIILCRQTYKHALAVGVIQSHGTGNGG